MDAVLGAIHLPNFPMALERSSPSGAIIVPPALLLSSAPFVSLSSLQRKKKSAEAPPTPALLFISGAAALSPVSQRRYDSAPPSPASAFSRRHSRRCFTIVPHNNSPSQPKRSASKMLNAQITEFHAIYTVEAVCENLND